MKYILKNLLKTTLAIISVLILGYYYTNDINQINEFSEAQVCKKPIAYSIGKFDERFGISKKDFLELIEQAAVNWESPIDKDLFEYSETGSLKINLIYDLRQESTIKLQKIGIEINSNRATYETLKAKYEALNKSYSKEKSGLEVRAKEYQAAKDAYEKSASYWNDRGGAPKETFKKLEQQRISLNNLVATINQEQNKLNELIGNINAAATVLNELASELNLHVDKYNSIGEETGQEFQEGEYKSDGSKEEINIYQFDNKKKLTRVLMHELGHALDLNHVKNPEAIMYRLNQGESEELTADDIALLKQACEI